MRSKAEHNTDHGIYGSPGDVSPWDVRFEPEDRAHLDIGSDGTGRLRVWTEPGLTAGRVVVRRRGVVSSQPLEMAATTRRFSFWEAVVADLSEHEFSFAFRGPNHQPIYVAPTGITNAIERLDRWRAPEPQPFDPPAWSQGAVIYQIFPDRFARGGDEVDGVAPWGSPPHAHEFKGGDLVGIASKLDHLADLGVEVLYLNPVFTSPSNHRYDAIDYYNVDPMLGGNSALDALVDQVHGRGMRLILDGSFNHVHPHFFAFEDVVRRGEASEYWDWFIVESWPLRVDYRPEQGAWVQDWVNHWRGQLGIPIRRVRTRGPSVEPSYEAWYGVPAMPRVNLANPGARQYMLDVATYWIKEHGIDGWRMDVARYVDPDFWTEFRSAVKRVDPDSYLIAEVMGDASVWLDGNRFDATMNYTFRDIATSFLATDLITGQEALDRLTRLWAQYSWPVTLANQNLLDSHDTTRFVTKAAGNERRLQLATLLQMTYPGAPGIYYGNEVALPGGDDPGSRASFPWSRSVDDHQMYQTIRALARLRRRNAALRQGAWQPWDAGKHWLAFERALGSSRIVTAINRGRISATVPLPRSAKRVLWGSGGANGRHARVAPQSGLVVRV